MHAIITIFNYNPSKHVITKYIIEILISFYCIFRSLTCIIIDLWFRHWINMLLWTIDIPPNRWSPLNNYAYTKLIMCYVLYIVYLIFRTEISLVTGEANMNKIDVSLLNTPRKLRACRTCARISSKMIFWFTSGRGLCVNERETLRSNFASARAACLFSVFLRVI